jgi:lipopolysaccharide/colanic/teichoic acid biosynthesis glycosyltransferase
VILACDGCTDATAAHARATAVEAACRHLQLKVLEFPQNRGKVAVLNDVVPSIETDLVALTDASALLSIDALLIAARHFEDARTGVVCATYRLLEPHDPGEALYWSYQVELKLREAALGAPLGAHGALYLFRSHLFQPLPADTINDDFILPMSIHLRWQRCVYSTSIMALELERTSPLQDRRRRRRIAAGNVQQVFRLRSLLHPRHGTVAFAFASGKALRAVVPFLLVLSLIGSLALAHWSPWFAGAAAVQALIYALALLPHVLPGRRWPKPVELSHYVAGGHAAGLVGATRYLLALERGSWSGAAHKQEAIAAASQSSGPSSDEPAQASRRNRTPRRYRLRHVHPFVAVAKRALDVSVALLTVTLALPLFLLIMLAIQVDDSGPIFFRQWRIGEGGRPFRIIKFRTMKETARSSTEARWACDESERITHVGRLLRRTHLDELPQLLNVLRGEMSLVGPRPEQPAIVQWLDAAIPRYAERLYGVRPGITGFAQVCQGPDHALDDVRSKLSYDHAYALALGRPSTWLTLELRILARTLLVVGKGSGA